MDANQPANDLAVGVRKPSVNHLARIRIFQFDAAIVPLEGSSFGVLKVIGNESIQAEQLRDYEVGYRAQVTRRFSLDVAAFRSYYRHLESSELATPYFVDTPEPPHEVFPLDIQNGAGAALTAAKFSPPGTYQPLAAQSRLQPPPYERDSGSAKSDRGRHWGIGQRTRTPDSVSFRGWTTTHLDWDTSVSFVGQVTGDQIPGYTRLDTQLRWRVGESLEFSVTGQNLLTARHAEFGNTYGVDYTQVLRSVLGKITWRF